MTFGATTTAAEILDGIDLTGRRAIVTGGASGIGLETARTLATAGAEVTVAVRDTKAAASARNTKTATSTEATTGAHNANAATSTEATTGMRDAKAAIGEFARIEPLDLADQQSIARFVRSWSGPLHILVNNAGIMATPELRTPEGWELQFATNHLGHFALALGLHDALAAAGNARIVSVSSVGHTNGDVDFDDIHFQNRPYDPWQAYSQSKTANILFAVEAAKRWSADGITANALNPGRIAGTNLGRHMAAPPASFDPAGTTGVSVKDVAQGAATSVLLAASPLVEGMTGRYFEDCRIAEPHRPGVRRGVAAYALDPVNAARLWEVSSRTLQQLAA